MPETFIDFISEASGGMQSGIAPILLQKNQYGIGINTSIRGGFIHPRPPIQKKNLIYPDPLLQTIVETGFFQGGGYYRPDYGSESLLAQISGHLIKFTETGSLWSVTDISVPNDLNAATISQVWMWQSEKWMIVNDGSGALPIFFNGTTSRRSYGASVLLGSVTAVSSAGPNAIGDIIAATLAAPYTGAFNVPVIFNQEFYQPTEFANYYPATITNSTASSYPDFPIGSQVFSVSNILASVTGAAVVPSGQAWNGGVTGVSGNPFFNPNDSSDAHYYAQYAGVSTPDPNLIVSGTVFTLNTISGISYNVGDLVLIPFKFAYAIGSTGVGAGGYFQIPISCQIVSKSGNTITFRTLSDINPQSYFPFTVGMASFALSNIRVFPVIVDGGNILLTIGQIRTLIGKIVVSNFTPPLPSASAPIKLSGLFTGIPLTPCVIVNGSTEANLLISPVPAAAPTATLLMINLSDTAAITGLPLPIYSVPELPAGRMGAYGMGRNWMSLTDGISYVAGDIVGGAAGTQAENYRDAVLKMTENDFLKAGGTFRLPGTGDIITAMTFPAMMDTSLGQGALQIFTAFSAFSNNSPPDRATWAALTYPIQTESLKGRGALGQNSTIDVNSDTFFRSAVGVGSLILARRDFVNNSWGNKPISNEMARILNRDNQTLLSYSSAVEFDNRFLVTCAPNVSGQGVFHIVLVSLNFDLLSSLRGNLPPSWEGVWTGVNSLQAVCGRVNGESRSFAFTFNMDTQKIELWEFLKENTTSFQDNDTTPIVWVFETPVMFNKDIKPLTTLVQLNDGEVYLSDIKGTVTVKIQYRPDFYPGWTDWREFTVCEADLQTETNPQAGYRMRIGLGQPSVIPCEAGNNRPLRNGYFFQCRVTITGYCQWHGMRATAIQLPEPKFAPVECSTKPCQAIDCVVPDDLRVYSLQGLPPLPLPPVPPPDFKYSNSKITRNYCPGSAVNFTGSLPGWLTIDGENLIVSAGVFKGATLIGADNNAQSALASFISTNNGNGSLTCGTVDCDNSNVNNYAIQGYYDGLIPNPEIWPPSGGETTWDGTFKINWSDNVCARCGWTGGGTVYQVMDGNLIKSVIIASWGSWFLEIRSKGCETIWSGTKALSANPDGVYTNNGNGVDSVTPATLTIVQIAGVAEVAPCSTCS